MKRLQQRVALYVAFRAESERGRSVHEDMKKNSAIVLLVVLLVGCSHRDRVERVWHPLVMKYLRGTPTEAFWIAKRGQVPFVVRSGRDGEQQLPLRVEQTGSVMRYPEFSAIVRDCQIVVTNSIIACDIADLVWVVMHGGPSEEFLVESAERTGLAWRVQSRYYGSPDDAHRRSRGYVFSIMLDHGDLITNLVVEALPPLVTIGAQNKSMQATPNGAPDG